MARAILIVWAGAATILAIHFATREPPPVRVERRDRGRTVALERRVRELQSALGAALAPAPDATETPDEIGDLFRRYRNRGENPAESQALLREMYRRIGSDAASHWEIMKSLAEAEDDDAAVAVVELLVLNPFTRLTRNSDVTRRIRDQARELMASGPAWRRDAAARILFGYEQPTRDDVLLGMERLADDPDADVRDTLLEQLSDHARGVALTSAEAAPFLDTLRDQLARGETWTASAIAAWSAEEADFDRLRAGFREAQTSSARQDYLNGFRAGSRMGGRHPDRCRAVLLEVVESGEADENTRSMALGFLEEYAPWDAETADRVRRAQR